MKTRKTIREEKEVAKGPPARPIYIGIQFVTDWTFSPPVHVASSIKKKRLEFKTFGLDEDVFLYVKYKRDGKNYVDGEVIASAGKFKNCFVTL